jgi:hypothetical protein
MTNGINAQSGLLSQRCRKKTVPLKNRVKGACLEADAGIPNRSCRVNALQGTGHSQGKARKIEKIA